MNNFPRLTDSSEDADQPNRPLHSDTAGALQQALAAEHAAIWAYGVADAFVTGPSETELSAGLAEHRARRDAIERLLTDGGVTPRQAEPAYVPPQQVNNQTTALAMLAIAEADAGVAWRTVLEHTDEPDLRRTGLTGLTDSAVRQTRWRRLSGQSPASISLPGQPSS